jgi:hypothetical protein
MKKTIHDETGYPPAAFSQASCGELSRHVHHWKEASNMHRDPIQRGLVLEPEQFFLEIKPQPKFGFAGRAHCEHSGSTANANRVGTRVVARDRAVYASISSSQAVRCRSLAQSSIIYEVEHVKK